MFSSSPFVTDRSLIQSFTKLNIIDSKAKQTPSENSDIDMLPPEYTELNKIKIMLQTKRKDKQNTVKLPVQNTESDVKVNEQNAETIEKHLKQILNLQSTEKSPEQTTESTVKLLRQEIQSVVKSSGKNTLSTEKSPAQNTESTVKLHRQETESMVKLPRQNAESTVKLPTQETESTVKSPG